MLLDDIIDILSDTKGSLTDALLKTKVLLHQIGKKDLAAWVNNELKGYPGENVPDYRIVSAEVRGHVVSFRQEARNYLLPILHLTQEQQDNLRIMKCQMSIEAIEESIKRHRIKSSAKLIRSLPPEYGVLLQEALAPGTNVISAWCQINMVDVANILTEVRSRLLDFTLELRDVVGIDVPEKELAEKAATADTEKMFTTAVYGTGHTIIIGSHHIQAVTNQKDDIEGLLSEVAKLGFQQAELDELRKAVIEDKSKGRTPDVTEGETTKWYTKALKEAGKGVVKAGVDVVSSVIVKALGHYTGNG
jgi:hypothetical protein